MDRSQSVTHDTGRKLNSLIIGVLTLVVVLLLSDKFLLQSEDAREIASKQPVSAPVALSAETNSIAVLPFVDMSPDKDQEYFTDGLTENLLHALAQIRQLKVAGRTSSFAFKGKNTDLREIGQQLNVGSILEGSVQKAGGKIRITTQLINTEDGYHLWSKTFDRDLADIFSVQDEIAGAVASALKKSLLGDGSVAASTSNVEAYNAYLFGLSYYYKTSQTEWDKAIEQFKIALDLDPDMALAWAGLSRAYTQKTGFSTGFEAGFGQAREAALKAIELDPNLADGYLALAEVQRSFDWDWDGSQASLNRAAELRPGDPDIVAGLAILDHIRGEPEKAIAAIEAALMQDPLNMTLLRGYVGSLTFVDRTDEALARAQWMAKTLPDGGAIPYTLSNVYLRRGEFQKAMTAIQAETFDFLRWEQEAVLHQKMGDHEAAQQSLDKLASTYGDDVSWQIATVYTYWGDIDESLAALERGFAVRDPGLAYIKGFDTMTRLLAGNPRYEDLLRRMNLL